MKKLYSVLCVLIIFSLLLTGCKGKNNTLLYNYSNIEKYVTLGKYKDITVDSSSKEFKEYVDSLMQSDLASAELVESRDLTTSDTVENGDTVVIDFVGKMDGKAFDGGSSENYELTIGSGSMIDGFESGIIGASLNKTITINLNFPDPYPNNEDLSGKPVSFDITVKSGTRTSYPEITLSIAKKLGFETVNKYNEDVKNRALKDYLCDLVIESSKTKSYPEKELELLYNETTEYYEQMCDAYGMTFDEFLENQNMTMDDYKKQVTESLKGTVDAQLVFYAIAQNEKIKITDEDKNNLIKTAAKENDMTQEEIKEQISDTDLEYYTLIEKVTEFLVEENKLI